MGRALKTTVAAEQLASGLGLALQGPAMGITCAGALSDASPGALCFVKAAAYIGQLQPGTLVITTEALATPALEAGASVLVSRQPRLDFARALDWLNQHAGFAWSTQPAQVHPTAQIGQHVVLGRGVRIGAHTRVLHHVVIGDEVEIGERCVIKSCAVIGEDGFGFERAPDGSAVRLPHLGTVRTEDDVEVGSLTTVCRGTLGSTVLRRGSKVDDHVHIAHNVDVGEHAFVIACAEVSGGVTVGTGAWIAPCATVKNQVRIGDRAVIGLGAVVLKDVEADQVVVGNPGKPLAR